MTGSPGDSTDDPARTAERLYTHLSATAELPLDRHASRVLGEAEAVADDLRGCESATRARRADVVCELLAAVESTGHADADDHLETARALANQLASTDE